MAKYNKYMPFWVGDYLRDTTHLTAQRHGIYTLLIFHYWSNECLPSDIEEIYMITKAFNDSVKKDTDYILQHFFTDNYKHERIEQSLADSKNKYQKRVDAQAKSVASRKEKNSNANSYANSYVNSNANCYTVACASDSDSDSISYSKSKKISKNDVDIVFGYWKEKLNHPRANLDDKRKKNIANALKLGYGIDDLKAAIDGCSMSDWNMGANDRGRKFDGLHIILKDADNIDTFISIYNKGGAKAGKGAELDSISQRAIDDFVNGSDVVKGEVIHD